MRVDKYISESGIASRKEASRVARQGGVTVDGEPCRDLSRHIDPERAEVVYLGRKIEYRKFTYIMLNKPEGYVSATDDKNLPTVLELLPPDLQKLGLFPCGRLDRNTVGLMLITDDGELSHFLLSPVSHVPKTYGYACESPLSDSDVAKLESGVDIGEEKLTKPASLIPDESRVGGTITLSEGRYHQIKRMFESVGNKITYLERLTFGPLTLDTALSRGEWRYLTDGEIVELQKHNRNTNSKT